MFNLPIPELIQNSLKGEILNIWTAMPGFVTKFNEELQTVEVQVTISLQGEDGKEQNISTLVDVPLFAYGTFNYALTMPIKDGDEGLVVFASRCIDLWWKNGGVNRQAELRHHDLSDGFFIPGFRSIPNKIPAYSKDNVVIRNRANDQKFTMLQAGDIHMENSGGKFELLTSGNHKLTGNLEITGNMKVGGDADVDGRVDADGEIKSLTDVKTSTISLNTHKHISSSPGNPTGPSIP